MEGIEKDLYLKWKNMEYRCERTHHKQYKDYGGRGIKVCPEWKVFETFYQWAIESGYEKGLTLDRVNNDGNYEPSNCRWATMAEQGRNRRGVLEIVIDGVTKNAYEWCEIYDINYMTYAQRKHKLGWDDIKAITTPIKNKKGGSGFKKRVR